MTEAMNKNTVPKVERPGFFSRLIGRYTMYRYMPEFPEDEQLETTEVDMDAFAREIDACVVAGMRKIKADLANDGVTSADIVEAEILRLSRSKVLDDLRTLADSELE